MHETIRSLSTAISEKWTMSFWLRGPQREPQTKPLKVYSRSYFTGGLPSSPWLKITHDMTKKEKKKKKKTCWRGHETNTSPHTEKEHVVAQRQCPGRHRGRQKGRAGRTAGAAEAAEETDRPATVRGLQRRWNRSSCRCCVTLAGIHFGISFWILDEVFGN